MPEKAIIIARVSTLKQEKEGLSLQEIQLPLLRDYAKDKGFILDKEFTFSETADEKIRRKFNDIITYVKSHPDVRNIISFRVDRVTRNYRDAVLFDGLRMDYDKQLHFVYDRLVLDKKSMGRDIQDWDTKVYLAKQVINRLREDAINSAQAKLSRGEINGKAPYGYRNITLPNTNNQKWVEVEPFEAMIVKEIYEWYASSAYSMDIIRTGLKEKYDLKMSKGKLDFILKCRFYYGEIEYDGQIYPHKYETIVTREQYEKVQAIKLGFNKKHYKFAGLPYIYRGIMRCAECGLAITPEKKKGKYVYYHCTEYNGKHNAQWVREEDITAGFKSMLATIKMPDDVLNDLTETLRASHKDKSHNVKTLHTEWNAEYNKIEHRIEQMYEDQLDGRITHDMYDKKYKEYRKTQSELQDKMNKLQKADDEYYITCGYLLKLASKAGELFESSEPAEKREILKLLLQNCTLDGTSVCYDLKKPFDTLFDLGSRHIWLPRVDSNRQPYP